MLKMKLFSGRLAMTLAFAIMALTLTAPRASATVLWDNDIALDGFNTIALSPFRSPNNRTVDDFTVGAGGWIINDFHANVTEDSGWVSGKYIELFIYNSDGTGGSPGTHFISVVTDNWSKMFNNTQLFGRDDYDYWIEGLSIAINPGTYWIGFRNPNGSGGNTDTNWWATSTGGPDGSSSSTAFFSRDSGSTWVPLESLAPGEWHMTFEITTIDVPEPGTLAIFGFGLLGLGLARRRRKTA